jgi:hypothetical protein
MEMFNSIVLHTHRDPSSLILKYFYRAGPGTAGPNWVIDAYHGLMMHFSGWEEILARSNRWRR